MLSVKIICVGKLKEKFYIDGVKEYAKRLGAFCKLDIEELSERRLEGAPSPAEISAALKKEAEDIRGRIPRDALKVALCVEGEQMDSVEFAGLIDGCGARGISRLCFIIGGSNGLDGDLKAECKIRLSMSKMTFPHHLARVMLLEQIYRGFMINSGGKYHK